MKPAFREGIQEEEKGQPFTTHLLPDSEKERLCRSLLAEFGATTVSQSGVELKVSCVLPWHDDRNPSAQLNYQKLTYKCFSCDSSGGLLWLIGSCRGTSGHDARRWLSKETGEGDVQDLSSLLAYFDSLYQKGVRDSPMPKMDPSILKAWNYIHPYMTEIRGIPEDTLTRFRVGWNPQTNRIVIPHFWQGDLVGWTTRRLDPNDPVSKYKNSADFPKDKTVFNYDPNRKAAIIVESPTSVLSKWHLTHGVESTMGAGVTDNQMRLLRRHPKLVLFFDNDDAGWLATNKVGEACQEFCVVMVANNVYAADPADLSDEIYRESIEQAIPFALWTPPEELQSWNTGTVEVASTS